MTPSRADLHVHSKHSDRPSEWFLRRIGAPESFVEPRELYRACRERGMDFVTVSDHNCIRGALDIADLPGTFVSAELTTYFPEDGCKVHCLVAGITEKDFGELQEARANIYEFQRALAARNIIHSIAHPLFRVNDRLTPDHVEKLILLFKRFEGINGTRDPRAGRLAAAIFEHLTPEFVASLAERHGLAPTHPEPWKKWLTGGSDDHSGLYSAGAWTETPRAATVFDFLQRLRDGEHAPGGRAGTSLRLAHSLYHIAYSYYRARFLRGPDGDRSLVGAMLRKLAGEGAHAGVASRNPLARVVRHFRTRRLSDIERTLVDEFAVLVDRPPVAPAAAADERNFHFACRVSQQLSLNFIQRFVDQVRKGSLIESLQSVAALGPVWLGIAPYLTAFGTQHKDERFLQGAAARFPGASGHVRKTGRRAWVTDTFQDVNGVAHTIHTLAGLAAERGVALDVLTCRKEVPKTPYPLRNFEPVGTFVVPEYRDQTLVFPPFLEFLEHVEREGYDELIVSTPGPMGLCALGAARLLGVRVTGIYHTDFPQYMRQWTDDDAMEELTWRYMRWFYGNLPRVFVPSHVYREQLLQSGFRSEQLAILPRGIRCEQFNPGRRDPDFYRPFGLNGGFKFLYVGRVSEEKNLDVLLRAYEAFSRGHAGANLIVVGDGPALADLKKTWRRSDIAFTGYLGGDRLAAAYASADAFVFPSRTDTFGNAVLEAHASGLPAIVSDEGGPAEIVASHASGLSVDTRRPEALAGAMARVMDDETLRERLRTGALARADESR